MRILVDADALPRVIKNILFRVAERRCIPLTLVANQPVAIDKSEYIERVAVPAGSDAADDRIVELVGPGDLVITADIPLADRVVAKGAFAIDPRGKLYTEENVKDRLASRDLMDGLRNGGIITGGPAAFSRKDRQTFTNQLDRFLTRHQKKETQMNGRNRKDINPGVGVKVVQKQDQRSGRLTEGIVKDVLTKSPTHPHGIKVRLTSGIVGRVKEVLPVTSGGSPQTS